MKYNQPSHSEIVPAAELPAAAAAPPELHFSKSSASSSVSMFTCGCTGRADYMRTGAAL